MGLHIMARWNNQLRFGTVQVRGPIPDNALRAFRGIPTASVTDNGISLQEQRNSFWP